MRRILRLVRLVVSVNQAGQLMGQDLLGLIELAALPLCHLVDLLQRQEGQHAQALDDVRIADVSPVLIEVVGGRLVRIQPHGAADSLAHLLALRVEEQVDGHRVRVLAKFLPDQLRAGQHVGPLVIAAELHAAAVFLVQHVEIVSLHQHVGEFQEGKPVLQPVDIASGAEHVVDRKLGSDVAHEFQEVQVPKPVGIVDHQRLVLAEINEARHLLPEALAVVVDLLHRHHLAHVRPAGRITDHTGTAAHQRNRTIAGHLQPLHQAQRHKVAHMQAVCRRVKADIERGLPRVHKLSDLLFIRYLRQKSPGLQFFIYAHFFLLSAAAFASVLRPALLSSAFFHREPCTFLSIFPCDFLFRMTEVRSGRICAA